jgi:hypothetical protein
VLFRRFRNKERNQDCVCPLVGGDAVVLFRPIFWSRFKLVPVLFRLFRNSTARTPTPTARSNSGHAAIMRAVRVGSAVVTFAAKLSVSPRGSARSG